ncbi:MAG: type II secretion system protein [Patescibacteria group bacterium]
MKSGTGFTLLEVLLSIAIIGVLAATGVPIYQSLQNRNDLDIAATSLAQALRRAQTLSQAVDGDSNWGVSIQAGNIILFQGISYATRNSNFDETTSISPTINLSGFNEVVFSKFSGLPISIGSLTLTSLNNETRTLSINTKGTVIY